MARDSRSISPIVVALLCAACGSTTTERDGRFTLRRERVEFAGHSETRTTLLYDSRTLTEHLNDWTVDPRSPDRIVFSARRTEGAASPCGTYFFDGKAQRSAPWKMTARVLVVHDASKDEPVDRAGTSPWSPDGRYVYVGNDIARPVVFDVIEHRAIEVSRFLAAQGRRLELTARVWSSDSRHLAVEVAPNGYNGGRDLAVIRVVPPFIQYVASMIGPLPLWTTADYRWSGANLVVNESGKNGPIVRKAEDEIGWSFEAPADASMFINADDQTCP